jgi:hypothetical protein
MTMSAFPTHDPARVAADLRRRIAHHDYRRRARCALIHALDDYARRLMTQNMVEASLVGRLRRDAAHFEADAARVRRNRRLAIIAKTELEAAA